MTERALGGMFGFGRDPEFDAQELAYDAMEAAGLGDLPRAIRLAKQAVEINPACVDAQMLLSEAGSKTPQKRIENAAAVVSLGEQALGPKFFKQNRGYFWGLLETRPYMRARAALAGLLADAGRTDEAVAHYEALLDLNPNDNQGLRYELLDLYLETGRLAPAAALFKQFDGERSAMFTWGRVLERFLSGAAAAARVALAEARKANAYVEPFLTGRKRLPRETPDCYSPGQESEAVVCMDLLGRAWRQHPEAIGWLKGQG
jgi:tetratricopeptide (TPR) repeat protein